MRIEYSAEGHKKIESLLEGWLDDQRDDLEKRALVESSLILEKRVSMLSSPRSAGSGRDAKYKGRAKAGHILDFVTHNAPAVSGDAWSIETGINMAGGYKSRQGFGYANPLEYGTSTMRAQPFLNPTFASSQEQMIDAIQKSIREGLGL